MDFTTGAALLELCASHQTTISQLMLAREAEHLGADRDAAFARMRDSYGIMKRAATLALDRTLDTMGGLIGGNAAMLHRRGQTARPVCGKVMARAVECAMSVLEVNASMGLIVAAPTAGSSGVIPGVFLALQEEFGFSDDEMTDALWNTGAVGYLLTLNATVAGAEGGCQAEVGAACAMAASAAVQLMGGTPEQCLNAASIAISNILGLVCDPIAGLVEAPCQTRNAMGVSNALASAEIALAGVPCLVPFDQMVEAMYRVGRSIPFELRETALGGCAATPAGCALCKKIFL